MENKDLSRYEETPTKENAFVKAFKAFGKYLKGVLYDFIASFKFNNMKLPGILIAIPGILIGFFLVWHAPVVKELSFLGPDQWDPEAMDFISKEYLKFDFSGIVLFVLMLVSLLNIFTASSVMKKKNLGSVIVATITTTIIAVAGVLYLWLIFYFKGLVDNGQVVPANKSLLDANGKLIMSANYIMSIVSVCISIVSSVVGVVLGYIFYDRTYEKVDR
jgi:hypothetical protein